MSDNIIPMRPRDQVPRAIRSFRSEPPEFYYVPQSAPMRIEGTVILSQFIRALHFAGLTYQHDKRTGEFVVMPAQKTPAT